MELMGLVPGLVKKDTKSDVIIVHDCKVPKEEDVVTSMYPGDDITSRITRWVTRKRVMSPTHYYAQTCLKSATAIKQEISQHLTDFSFMIHPYSQINNFWSMFMMGMTFMMLMVTPVLNAFYFERHWNTLPILVTIDLILFVDVGLHFVTGIFEKKTKTVVMDPVVVAHSYLKGWFAFDLASAIPVELFDYMTHGRDHESWWCSLFNFMKLFRMRNLLHYISQFRKAYHFSFQKGKTLEMAIAVCINLHWAACIVYYVPVVVLEFSDNPYRPAMRNLDLPERTSWILSSDMDERATQTSRYLLCLNRATISLISSAHYLNVATTEDMILNLLLAIWAQLLVLMSTKLSNNKEHLIHLKQLQDYMRYKQLPVDTQNRLVVYYNYWHKTAFNRDRHILEQVSEPLREELTLHQYRRMLETVDLFKYLPQEAIMQLAGCITLKIFLMNDVIVQSGIKGENLYFVDSGTVAVYTKLGKEVCHLEEGSYFGEIALLMENEYRVASVVAVETCQLLTVPREAFQYAITPYPNLLIRLQKVAIERLARTGLLDDVYGLVDENPTYINISNFRGKMKE